MYFVGVVFFFFKQKTAYEMRISDWSSDVCSSDLVGYVGRDVEQIIRDLVEIGIAMLRAKKRKDVQAKAHLAAELRVLDALVGKGASEATRESFRRKLREGELDEKEIEVEVADQGGMPNFDIPGMPGGQIGMVNLGDM